MTKKNLKILEDKVRTKYKWYVKNYPEFIDYHLIEFSIDFCRELKFNLKFNFKRSFESWYNAYLENRKDDIHRWPEEDFSFREYLEDRWNRIKECWIDLV